MKKEYKNEEERVDKAAEAWIKVGEEMGKIEPHEPAKNKMW